MGVLAKKMTRREALLSSAAGFLSLQACALNSGAGQLNSEITTLSPQNTWALPKPESVLTEVIINSGKAKLWCLDSGGNGEAIVFVHPFSGSAEVWSYQHDYFINKGYRVIAYSRRGHFGSSAEGYGDDENATTDLLAVVNQLDLKKFHLVGMAAGADILPDFAASYSNRLLSLSIGCTIGKPGDPAYSAHNDWLLPKEFRALPTWLKELSPSYRAAFPEGVAAWKELQQRSLLKRHPMKLANNVTPERIASIQVPTLLFTGDADLYMPPYRLAKYAKYWNNPEVYIFSEAGHAPQWEQPNVFNKLLENFISKYSNSNNKGHQQ